MAIERKKDAHLWVRDQHDWYVEPFECSLGLFDKLRITGLVWDPACGCGRILKSANRCGLRYLGTDIIGRTEWLSNKIDFLSINDDCLPQFDHIVCNPPFKNAEQFVRRAIEISPTGGYVAMILPLVWLSGFSSKRDWLPGSPLRYFLPISPRPSMPPGQVVLAGEKPGNGTKDFAWFVWQIGYEGLPEVGFMNTKPFKKHGLHDDEGAQTCVQRQAAFG